MVAPESLSKRDPQRQGQFIAQDLGMPLVLNQCSEDWIPWDFMPVAGTLPTEIATTLEEVLGEVAWLQEGTGCKEQHRGGPSGVVLGRLTLAFYSGLGCGSSLQGPGLHAREEEEASTVCTHHLSCTGRGG